MKIAAIQASPTFKAHSYKINPKNRNIIIQTDNNPYLGEEPYLIFDEFGSQNEKKMEKEGDWYYANSYTLPSLNKFNYHIKYKDTNNIDLKNGKEYSVDIENLINDAAVTLRKHYRQPLIHAYKSGNAVGKIIYKDNFNWDELQNGITEPSILVTKNILTSTLKNPNIIGLIFTADDVGTLAHCSAMLRQDTRVCGTVFEQKTINKLKELNGKNVEIELRDNFIRFNKSDKVAEPMKYPKIEIPQLKYCDKILTSKEYSPELVGAKAYNLRKLEELVQAGKIDVKIPKSIALPPGYIQKMYDENPEQATIYEDNKDIYICKNSADAPYDEETCSKRMLDLIDNLKKNDIDGEWIMVRSAFNGEDLPGYSAAGIYRTLCSQINPEDLYERIIIVAQSKWEQNAQNSREKHKISDDSIQPTVILQNSISPDYKFTVYTDFDDNKLRIELYQDETWLFGALEQPNVFTYDKNTGVLTYDSIQLCEPYVNYDENFNRQKLEPIQDDLSNKPEVIELIHKLIDNALIIEKEFGKPQDIEGGFKDNDIYLWQTRNIVN